MDRAVAFGKAAALPTPAPGNDLGSDADRGLFRRTGAEVEPDRAGEPADFAFGETGLP